MMMMMMMIIIIIIIIIIKSMYRDTTNVEPEMQDYISNIWSHRNSNNNFQEKFGSCTKKTFSILTNKKTIFETSHIIRNVLQSETRTMNGDDHRFFNRRNTGKKKPMTRHNKNIITICRRVNWYRHFGWTTHCLVPWGWGRHIPPEPDILISHCTSTCPRRQ
jgi:hypothetical protein